MTDRKEIRPSTEEIEAVTAWIKSFENYDHEGNVDIKEPDKELLVKVFSHFSADFKEKPGMEALGEYSNLRRRPGMDAVWGQEYVNQYNDWTQQWAIEYEETTGKKLPRLVKSGKKTSGPRQWLGELTAYLAGYMDFGTYKRHTEARLKNGWLYAESQEEDKAHLKEKRIKIQTSAKPEPMRPSSIAPGFVKKAWKWMKIRK